MQTSFALAARRAVAGLVLSTELACATPQLTPFDPSRPIQRDDGFQQEGRTLDPDDMSEKLSREPESAAHVSRARTLSMIAMILGAAGGALVGWPIGAKIGGDPNPQWGLAYAGAGAILVAVPLTLWGSSSLNSAVDAHNAGLATRAAE